MLTRIRRWWHRFIAVLSTPDPSLTPDEYLMIQLSEMEL